MPDSEVKTFEDFVLLVAENIFVQAVKCLNTLKAISHERLTGPMTSITRPEDSCSVYYGAGLNISEVVELPSCSLPVT